MESKAHVISKTCSKINIEIYAFTYQHLSLFKCYFIFTFILSEAELSYLALSVPLQVEL